MLQFLILFPIIFVNFNIFVFIKIILRIFKNKKDIRNVIRLWNLWNLFRIIESYNARNKLNLQKYFM